MRKNILRSSKTVIVMSDMTAESLVQESRSIFEMKVLQVLNWDGKCAAIRSASRYFGLSESQGRRVFDGRLKSIDGLTLMKLKLWEERQTEAMSRRSELTEQAAQDVRERGIDGKSAAVAGLVSTRDQLSEFLNRQRDGVALARARKMAETKGE